MAGFTEKEIVALKEVQRKIIMNFWPTHFLYSRCVSSKLQNGIIIIMFAVPK